MTNGKIDGFAYIDEQPVMIVGQQKGRDTKDKISSRLLMEIDKTEGRVGIATASFELVNPPPFEVQLTESKPLEQ